MIRKRSELLFLYDVTNGNPNGDPADENKPRIDEESGVNIVTDVRLKRTIRDYLFNYKGFNGEDGKDIFVRELLASKGKKGAEAKGIMDGKQRALCFDNSKEGILAACIDVRLFGGVIPMDKDSHTFTGPVQFKMGHSLHKVTPMYIKGTGAFASSEGKDKKTFREEYVLPYSLIAFYGVINENAAKHTNMSDEDQALLLEGMWRGTKNLITRSKMEHAPRLLLMVTYKDPSFFIGELDKYISLEKTVTDESLRDISEVKIDLSQMVAVLMKHRDAIEEIGIQKDERTVLLGLEPLKELVRNLNL